ncbi:MAG TPA: Holliday junction resolvase RuvX [Bacteroidales bacterium]|nr:Holliday junction resolvase RuvX [Bacteroidales bacterium]HOU97943.1 Holliday junction resolvase RuvX [Bacteroidales bacterium]
MSRIMAIDYGQKRVGIAVSDPLQIIATGLTTIHSKDIFTFLDEYIAKENVETIVVGQAKQLNNKASESMRFIQPFFKKLQARYPSIKCTFYDERFTSKMALQSMIDCGTKKSDRQNKETIDMVSATILLQDFMNFIKNKPI